MQNPRNMLMLAILALSFAAPSAQATEWQDNPQMIYHEDKQHLLMLDAAPAASSNNGFMPYQGDVLDDKYEDDPVKLYSTPGLGFVYQPESTPHTQLKFDLHGAAVNDDPDARAYDLLHTPGHVEAGASFHF